MAQRDSDEASQAAIRLRAADGALGRLLRVPPLGFLQAEASECPVEAVFFDTRRGLLRKAGLSLHVEHRDATWTQVLLAGDGTWNRAASELRRDDVEGPEPRADLLAEVPGFPSKAVGKPMQPMFRLDLVQQEMILPSDAGGAIDVVIEVGSLVAGKATEAVRDVVLSAGEGTTEGELCRLALALHRLEPLAVATRGPSEVGRMLADGKQPPWFKAGTVPLDPATTLDAGIAAILGQCFEQWMSNEDAARDGRDIEGVHQMRVAMRRLRAAFVFLAPWLEGDAAAAFDREVKWMARKLGAVRDLDVLLADTLAPVSKARGKDRDLKALRRAIAAAQAHAHEELTAAMATPRYTVLVLELGGWIADHGWRPGSEADWDEPVGSATRTALEAVYGQVLEAGGDFVSLDSEARHELRLEIKRLRYALQFVGGAFGDRAAPWARPLSALQDGLGAANDAVVAENLIAAVIATGRHKAGQERRLLRAGGMVTGWWLARADLREEALRDLWSAFATLEPFWRAERPRLKVVAGN